jgi:hypothetical protein
VPLEADIVMRRAGLPNFRVRIEDISPEGCRIEYIDRPRAGERVWVKFDNLDTLEAAVCWVRAPEAGIQFDQPIHPAVFASLIGSLR